MIEETTKSLKILITGANGQLGRCLQDVAVQFPDYDFHFKSSTELDITSKAGIESLFEDEKFDYCINCAAYTAVDKAETDKENAFLVNAEAVKYLAEACMAHNTVLIHISTDFVFDGTKAEPYTEEDIPNPLNVYGASKLKGEQHVQHLLNKYFIIRTSWVYSEYGNNFVKTMIRLGLEKDEISVVDDQIGSPTYAGDLAEVIMKIISSKAISYGLYHYSNKGEISWYDFAFEIFKWSNLKTKVNKIISSEYQTIAKRPIYSVLNTCKLARIYEQNIFKWKERLNSLQFSKF